MTTDVLHAVAQRILERMVKDHTTAFAEAINTKLAEIALNLGASRSWQLVRADPPTRQ